MQRTQASKGEEVEMDHKPAAYKFSELNIDEPVLQLDPNTINELNIDVGKPVQLKFGNLVTSVNVHQLNSDQPPTGAEIKISKKVS